MNKKLYKTLSTIWKFIGIVILGMFIYTLLQIDQGVVNDTFILITTLSLFLYSLITLIDFLSPGLVRFFRGLRKKVFEK